MEQKYLPHLSDALRRKIAVQYLQHEFRKLFPSLRETSAWQTIDSEVGKWFSDNPELAPVRDFWNGFHGITCGFKLKNLLPWLTSQNIDWQEQEINIDQLNFGNDFLALKYFKPNPTVVEVKKWYLDPVNEKVFEEAKNILQQYSETSSPRDNFSLLVVEEKGELRVIDGNRRLLKAIFDQQEKLPAIIGKIIKEPRFFETWMPTSVLLELTWLNQREFGLFGLQTKSIAKTIVALIKGSQAGQYEFFNRCLGEGLADKKLRQVVQGLL
ncbi:MAG: hypothetical protein NTV81_04230 [Candidatus Komeilibacteria bacterium]|nr:hypothetical protein [Candidatus Komeilibacteria bacterium]